MILWLTGQPGSGKTTLGRLVSEQIGALLIDGDHLRTVIPTGYDEAGRRANVYRAQGIAAWEHQIHEHVVVALVAPYRDQREDFKRLPDVREVYLHYHVDRGKGEYAVPDYELPRSPDLILNTSALTIAECVAKILELV